MHEVKGLVTGGLFAGGRHSDFSMKLRFNVSTRNASFITMFV